MEFNRSQGIALILVLWAVALAGVLLGLALDRLSYEFTVYDRFQKHRMSYDLARSGIAEAIRILSSDGTSYDGRQDDWANFQPNNDSLTVTIRDIGSRINVNAASQELVRNISGLTPVQVDSLLDWRDVDHDARIDGAEENFYQGYPYLPRNSLIPVIEELSLIRGWEGFDKTSIFTVYGPLNVFSADSQALDSLLIGAGADQIVAQFIVNDIIYNRSEDSGSLHEDVLTLEAWAQNIPNLTPQILDQIKSSLTIEGTINANVVSREVVEAIFAFVGADNQVASFLDYRQQHTFTNLAEMQNYFGADLWRRLRGYLSVRSEYFEVISEGKFTGYRSKIQLLVKRSVNQDKSWGIEVLAWEEQ